jgi:hypothetical protein
MIREVLEFAAEWDRVLLENDPVAVGEYMTDEWVYVGPTGLVPKADIIDWIASGRLAHYSMEVTGDIRAQIVSASVLLTARKRSTGTWDGQTYAADEWITQIYAATDGGWRCAFSQKTDAR